FFILSVGSKPRGPCEPRGSSARRLPFSCRSRWLRRATRLGEETPDPPALGAGRVREPRSRGRSGPSALGRGSLEGPRRPSVRGNGGSGPPTVLADRRGLGRR